MIKIADLSLWTENPRDPIESTMSDFDIIKRAIKNEGEKWNLPKLVQKMGSYYHFNKLPIVVKENEKNIVYDGNCRVALIKYLQNPAWASEIEGTLFPKSQPRELKDLEEIPCNVCDRDTALEIIYQDNLSNNTWTPLTQSYFEYHLLGLEKSLFLEFEEATGLISKHEKLNRRFVKDEVITAKNLESIGLKLNNGKLLTSTSKKNTEEILKLLISLIEDGTIKTRNDKDKETFRVSRNGELAQVLKSAATANSVAIQKYENNNETVISKDEISNDIPSVVRRTPVKKEKDIIFGRKLSLKEGNVNSLYNGIYEIYESFKKDDKKMHTILPIIGMSLRLLLDVAAREVLKSNEDDAYKTFLKKAKSEMSISKQSRTYLSVTNSWLDDKHNVEALFGKYAHGNIPVDKSNVMNLSKITGEIIEFYYKI